MKHLNGRAIAVSAMIAAVYTAVSLALSLFSFGVMQIRVAECLTFYRYCPRWGSTALP